MNDRDEILSIASDLREGFMTTEEAKRQLSKIVDRDQDDWLSPIKSERSWQERHISISKRDLGKHLAGIINGCSEGMSKEHVNSQGWIWLASKKTLAESILVQFC